MRDPTDIVRRSARAESIGDTHRVELVESIPVDTDWIVGFRGLEFPHRLFRETFTDGEFDGLVIGIKGLITLRRSRFNRDGRWIFDPDLPVTTPEIDPC